MNVTPPAVVDEQVLSVFEDYTVTGLSPLRIKRDSDSAALPFEPDSLVSVAQLVVGDRVRVENADGRLIVHGRANGVGGAAPNICINGTGRTNQRGYVSGTAVNPGTYMVDRWKAGGVTTTKNYALNPSAETDTTGYTAIPGPTGVVALTSATPSTTTAYGTKVMKCTWSTASGADVAGAYYAIDRVAAGLSEVTYSASASTTSRLPSTSD